uniref:Uncharacterized protein n=1 Tax=viral metagenome TaxID=1070528 RepID=A0A6C0C431_9ZZZZ
MKIVIVDKNGSISDLDWKKNIDFENMYKKAGLKKNVDFEKRNTWKIKDGVFVSVYAKNTGRANTENKYELPPPVDSELYFGKMIIIKHEKEEPIVCNCKDIDSGEWEKIYEKLMGGFEDLNEEEESEEEYVAPENLTKQGYEKDGFVVEDGEADFNTVESEDEEDWVSSNSEEKTDDSLEELDDEDEEEVSDEDTNDSEEEDEDDDEMPELISGSDTELQEEKYEY